MFAFIHMSLFSMPCLILGHDWEDPDDPTVIAENELMGAANSIDAAARKLMALRPRRVETKVESSSVFILFSTLFIPEVEIARLSLHTA